MMTVVMLTIVMLGLMLCIGHSQTQNEKLEQQIKMMSSVVRDKECELYTLECYNSQLKSTVDRQLDALEEYNDINEELKVRLREYE